LKICEKLKIPVISVLSSEDILDILENVSMLFCQSMGSNI